jgi:hypothetical protein
MKKSLVAFALVGGVAVPVVFALLGWTLGGRAPADAAALALLHSVQLPLWPMSKLFLDDPSGKHWLYLPLAAVLSNALIYAAVGLLAGWGLVHRAGFVAALVAALVILVAAWQGFGTGGAGFAIAATAALAGLALHRQLAR